MSQEQTEKLLLKYKDIPIEEIDTLKLKSDGENPNAFTEKGFEGLKASIAQYGIQFPILVNKDLLIADGEHRWKAAKELNLPTVPVKIAEQMDEEDRLILRQTLNKARGTHDDEKDAQQYLKLMELSEDGFEKLAKYVGQEKTEMLKVLDKKDDYQEDTLDVMQEYDKIKTPTTRPGDIWKLGGHILLCGDSTLPETWHELCKYFDEKPCMMVTDPPYNVDYGASKAHLTDKDKHIKNDAMDQESFYHFLTDVFTEAMKWVTGAQYIFMSSQEWPTLHRAFSDAGGHWSSTIIWVKDRFVLGRKDYHPQFEPMIKGRKRKSGDKVVGSPILYGWKEGQSHVWLSDRTQCDVWYEDRPSANKLHPTMKPVAIIRKAILNHAKPTQVVAEPFCGGGSTLIACEQTRRRCAGIELDPKFVDVIIKRWEHFTGEKAEKIGELQIVS